MPVPHVVDGPGFDAITCSRCGDCCEAFYLNTGPADGHGAALGFLETYGRAMARDHGQEPGVYYPDAFHHPPFAPRTGLTDMLWFGQLTATRREDGQWMAACGHFERDEDGLGVCGIYETRPEMCSAFPYGRPIKGYERCTWNVTVLEYEIVQGVECP